MQIVVEDELLGGEYFIPRKLVNKIGKHKAYREFNLAITNMMNVYDLLVSTQDLYKSLDSIEKSINDFRLKAKKAGTIMSQVPKNIQKALESRMPFEGYIELLDEIYNYKNPSFETLQRFRMRFEYLHKNNVFLQKRGSIWNTVDKVTSIMQFITSLLLVADMAKNFLVNLSVKREEHKSKQEGVEYSSHDPILASGAATTKQLHKVSKTAAKKITKLKKKDIERVNDTIEELVKLQHLILDLTKQAVRDTPDEEDVDIVRDKALDLIPKMQRLHPDVIKEFPKPAHQSILSYLRILAKIKYSEFDASVQLSYIDVILSECNYVQKDAKKKYYQLGIRFLWSIVLFGMAFTNRNTSTTMKTMMWLDLMNLILGLVDMGMGSFSTIRSMSNRIYIKMSRLFNRKMDPVESSNKGKKKLTMAQLVAVVNFLEKVELLESYLQTAIANDVTDDILSTARSEAINAIQLKNSLIPEANKYLKGYKVLHEIASIDDKNIINLYKKLSSINKDCVFMPNEQTYSLPVEVSSFKMITASFGDEIWRQKEEYYAKKRAKKSIIKFSMILVILFATGSFIIGRQHRSPLAKAMSIGIAATYKTGGSSLKVFLRLMSSIGNRITWPIARTAMKIPKSFVKIAKWSWG